jgi:hypothetical protein
MGCGPEMAAGSGLMKREGRDGPRGPEPAPLRSATPQRREAARLLVKGTAWALEAA